MPPDLPACYIAIHPAVQLPWPGVNDLIVHGSGSWSSLLVLDEGHLAPHRTTQCVICQGGGCDFRGACGGVAACFRAERSAGAGATVGASQSSLLVPPCGPPRSESLPPLLPYACRPSEEMRDCMVGMASPVRALPQDEGTAASRFTMLDMGLRCSGTTGRCSVIVAGACSHEDSRCSCALLLLPGFRFWGTRWRSCLTCGCRSLACVMSLATWSGPLDSEPKLLGECVLRIAMSPATWQWLGSLVASRCADRVNHVVMGRLTWLKLPPGIRRDRPRCQSSRSPGSRLLFRACPTWGLSSSSWDVSSLLLSCSGAPK